MKNKVVNLSGMVKEELFEKTKDTYISNNGIKIRRTFNENGKDINECFQNYFKKCLENNK